VAGEAQRLLFGMAIYHFSAKVIQRSEQRSAVAAAAYRAGALLFDERLGRSYNYSSKLGVVHSEILLPEGAPARWLDRAVLWNEVEDAERRKDAQLAREIELALPRELPPAEAIQLAGDFVRAQFVARGMVADLNVHWGTGADGAAQPHAHVMLSLREISGEGFGKKQRAWNDRSLLRDWREDFAALVNARLAEAGHDIRVDHRSNAAQGIELEPQNKIGPAGARRALRDEDAERADEHQEIARRNGARILADPALALAALTRQQSTFTRRDLARFVNSHTADAAQFDAAMARVEASAELVRVGTDGRGRERFSTNEMVAIERRMVESAAALDARPAHAVDLARRQAAPAAAGLGEEQTLAFFHVTRARDLTVVCGIAGGGKSVLFGAARQAWEQEGYRVRGAALSGIAAEGLERSTGIESRTLASLEYAWGQGRELLASNDILVVDEAGMLGSRQLGRLVETVRAAGAKLVLVGDPEQLQAIEAGAALRAIAERVGVAEISEPRRQTEGWQKEATKELASGRTAAALARYEAASMVHEHATLGDAELALAATWAAERRNNPQQSRLMLAHTRASARNLNDLARTARRAVGELGPDHVLDTAQGPQMFAAGERIYFLKNDRGLGVKNGSLGTLERLEGARLTVRLDGDAAGGGRAIAFDLGDYAEIGHGYAATIHKSQGATVDVAHVLATSGMDRHLAYVALSRHRSSVHLHWSAEEFGTSAQLAARLGRERAKDTSLDYEADPLAAYAGRRGLAPAPFAADADPGDRLQEIRARLARDPGVARRNLQQARIAAAIRPVLPALTQAVPRQEAASAALGKAVAILGDKARAHALAEASAQVALALVEAAERQEAAKTRAGIVDVPAMPTREPPVREAPARREPARREPMLAAVQNPEERDSLGRGLTPAEIAAAVARNPKVINDREELRSFHFNRIYRDPGEAIMRLAALEKAKGAGVMAAAKILQETPRVFGRLLGSYSWLASAKAQSQRSGALQHAREYGLALKWLSDSEKWAAVAYRHDIEAQQHRDRIAVPRLSEPAVVALSALADAGAEYGLREGAAPETLSLDEFKRAAEVSAAWTAARADGDVAAELDLFEAKVIERFMDWKPESSVRSGQEWTTARSRIVDAAAASDRPIHQDMAMAAWTGARVIANARAWAGGHEAGLAWKRQQEEAEKARMARQAEIAVQLKHEELLLRLQPAPRPRWPSPGM
jgi:Ti-type conjugative transfer relaxase TraA